MEELKDFEVVKELLEHFGKGKEQTAAKQHASGGFVARVPQFPCRQAADRETDECKQKVECPVGRRLLHGPRHPLKERIQHRYQFTRLFFVVVRDAVIIAQIVPRCN